MKGAAATVALLAVSGAVIDALGRPHAVASAHAVRPMKSTKQWFYPLPPRQAEVSMLVAAGLGNEEIAKAININRTTLDYHVHQVFSKLDFHRRSEIVDWVDRNRPARLLMSAREFHLTALIGAGFTNGEIASRFGVSERTLEVHVRSIGLKLDLQSRAQIRDWVMGPLRYDPLSRV